MTRQCIFIATALLVSFISGCRETGDNIVIIDRYKSPHGYNVQLIAHSPGIDDPSLDRRCYYKVFINKMEEGRTETALDSQKKYFKMSLPPNRHLLRVEKWVLDEKNEKYVKLNNIDQPKPGFIYFDVPENRIVTIELKVNRDGKAEYSMSHEKE